MRITVLTVGSRGDVQPLAALGVGLQEAGHEVTLATHGEWESSIRAAGLGFARVEGAPHRFMFDERGQQWMTGGSRPLAFLRLVYPLMRQLMREQLDDAVAACRGADALIFTPLAIAGYHVAQRLGIPFMGACLQPLSPTRAFPSPMLPPLASFGPTNRASHVLVERGYAQAWRGEVNRWRRSALGMPPVPPGFSYSRSHGERLHVLYGFSAAVVPRPVDWSSRLHVTGYWFPRTRGQWRPSRALVEFLEAGPAPIYAGFGSMVAGARAAAAVREAARRAGARVILAGDLGSCLTDAAGARDCLCLREVPHEWLLPRVAAMVHHGGAGTTAAGLRAGVPMAIVPLVSDQFFWAERVAALGAGPAPVPFRRLTARRLASAIRQSMGDPRMRQRAQAIGARIREEDGISAAVEVACRVLRFGAARDA